MKYLYTALNNIFNHPEADYIFCNKLSKSYKAHSHMPGLQSSTTEPGTWFILHQDPGPELPLLAAQQSEDPPPEQSGPIWSHNRTANERCNYPGYNKV